MHKKYIKIRPHEQFLLTKILQAISRMEMDNNWKRRAENFKVDQNQCSHSNVCSLLIAQKVRQNKATWTISVD